MVTVCGLVETRGKVDGNPGRRHRPDPGPAHCRANRAWQPPSQTSEAARNAGFTLEKLLGDLHGEVLHVDRGHGIRSRFEQVFRPGQVKGTGAGRSEPQVKAPIARNNSTAPPSGEGALRPPARRALGARQSPRRRPGGPAVGRAARAAGLPRARPGRLPARRATRPAGSGSGRNQRKAVERRLARTPAALEFLIHDSRRSRPRLAVGWAARRGRPLLVHFMNVPGS